MIDYDVEELIKIVTTPITKQEEKRQIRKEKKLPPDALKFVLAMGIKEGSTKYHTKDLYALYVKWVGKKVGSMHRLGRQLGKLFKKHRDNKGSYYLLDITPIEERVISEEKENKKRKSRVPRT